MLTSPKLIDPDQMARGMVTSGRRVKAGSRGPRRRFLALPIPRRRAGWSLAIRRGLYPAPGDRKPDRKKSSRLGANRPLTGPGTFLGPVAVWYNSQRRAGRRHQAKG